MLAIAGDTSTKGRVLALLKRGSSAAAAVACELGITVTAARRHLGDLQAAGLVEVRLQRPGGRGRPQHVYGLTREGEATFPRRYAELCADVLAHVETLYGTGAILEVLGARDARLRSLWAPRLADGCLEERLRALAAILCEQGYEASVGHGPAGELYLVEGNCPVLDVARTFGQLCQGEMLLYSQLLDVPVVRESLITQGAPVCRYRVG